MEAPAARVAPAYAARVPGHAPTRLVVSPGAATGRTLAIGMKFLRGCLQPGAAQECIRTFFIFRDDEALVLGQPADDHRLDLLGDGVFAEAVHVDPFHGD